MNRQLTILFIFVLFSSCLIEAQTVSSSARRINGTIEGTVIESWQSIHSENVAVQSNGSRYEFCIQCQGGGDDSPQIIGSDIKNPGTRVKVTYSKIERYKTHEGNYAYGIEARRIVNLSDSSETLIRTSAPSTRSWNSFWAAFKTAVVNRNRVAIKKMMSNPFGTGGGLDTTPDKWVRGIDELNWQGMRESVISGTRPCQNYSKAHNRPCRVTNNDYLVFLLGTDGRWRWVAVGGD